MPSWRYEVGIQSMISTPHSSFFIGDPEHLQMLVEHHEPAARRSAVSDTAVIENDPHIMYPRRRAAELLGLSESTLRRWAAEGHGPQAVRIGPRRIYYRGDALCKWVDQVAEEL